MQNDEVRTVPVQCECGLEEAARECPECGTVYFKGEDARIDAGLRCGRCAYPQGDNGDLADL